MGIRGDSRLAVNKHDHTGKSPKAWSRGKEPVQMILAAGLDSPGRLIEGTSKLGCKEEAP